MKKVLMCGMLFLIVITFARGNAHAPNKWTLKMRKLQYNNVNYTYVTDEHKKEVKIVSIDSIKKPVSMLQSWVNGDTTMSKRVINNRGGCNYSLQKSTTYKREAGYND